MYRDKLPRSCQVYKLYVYVQDVGGPRGEKRDLSLFLFVDYTRERERERQRERRRSEGRKGKGRNDLRDYLQVTDEEKDRRLLGSVPPRLIWWGIPNFRREDTDGGAEGVYSRPRKLDLRLDRGKKTPCGFLGLIVVYPRSDQLFWRLRKDTTRGDASLFTDVFPRGLFLFGLALSRQSSLQPSSNLIRVCLYINTMFFNLLYRKFN